jgi:hypothetical protein
MRMVKVDIKKFKRQIFKDGCSSRLAEKNFWSCFEVHQLRPKIVSSRWWVTLHVASMYSLIFLSHFLFMFDHSFY